jgi:hypothetical protein
MRLIKEIKAWRVKGLLSYSPDRQSRNLLEWWELINLVDEELVSLKYSNFHFDPNASGKMMLGIWFVFSKQYSDKLSEDTSRGMDSKHAQGRALWTFKHGYYFHSKWFHLPHPIFFDIWKEAFRMKLEDDVPDTKIRNYILSKWYIKEFYDEKWKKTGENTVQLKNLKTIRQDPFYYGVFTRKDNRTDLRDMDTWYEPLISEDQYLQLIDIVATNEKKPKAELKEEYDCIRPLPMSILKDPSWANMCHSFPNPARARKRLKKHKVKHQGANLWDVVKPNQIRYKTSDKYSPYWNKLELNYDIIDNAIVEHLKQIKPSERMHKLYKETIDTMLDTLMNEYQEEKSNAQFQLNKQEWRINDYIRKHLSFKTSMSDKELEIYEWELKRLQSIWDGLKVDLNRIEMKERNQLLEFESFYGLLTEAPIIFQNANYVRKRKIVQLLFSNIQILDDLSVSTYAKPWLEEVFSLMGVPFTSDWTHQ